MVRSRLLSWIALGSLLGAPAALAGTLDPGNHHDYTVHLVGQDPSSRSISSGFAYEWDNHIGPRWDVSFDWTGNDVTLQIDGATGDAILFGSMRRDGTSDVYTFEGTYSDFFTADRDFSGSFGHDEFEELIFGTDTSAFHRWDLDVAWSTASLEVHRPDGSLFASMEGKDDARTSAFDVAELQLRDGRLDFGAWWQDLDGRGRADTKAWGHGASAPVPEPGAAALFALGALAVRARTRRR